VLTEAHGMEVGRGKEERRGMGWERNEGGRA